MKLSRCTFAAVALLLTAAPVFSQQGSSDPSNDPPNPGQATKPAPNQKPDPGAAPEATPAPDETSNAASTEALAKAAQNPVANMISFPLQNNTAFGVGPYNRDQNVLNIQPVIPIKISENWNLITRTILPVVWQPNVMQDTQGWFGFGDLNPTFFFSPSKPSKLIWGAGPTFLVPTATADQLGQGKFGIGPSVVVLTTPGHWVIGALANNIWSVAGPEGRPAVNQFLLQYFVNYNLKKGWYLTSAPIITANWEANSGDRWNVPFGAGVGRIMKVGFQPMNFSVAFFGNAVHPPGASPWGMRLQVQLLFPKISKQQEKELLEKKLEQLNQQQPQKQ